jgi:hypothetical protein
MPRACSGGQREDGEHQHLPCVIGEERGRSRQTPGLLRARL